MRATDHVGERASTRIPYEPALDGLRAIAVLAVMLYHAGASWLPGGFLGVDLFFVLSGYLITTLLLVEWSETGTVHMPSFWRRRARRLMPALFLMLLAVAFYNATAVAEEERLLLRDHGIAALFYVGNWWQLANGQSYFAQFSNPSPLTHTWSLAIEEQWYLVFPLILSLALRARRVPRNGLAAVFLCLAALSASWMAWRFDPLNPSLVYFGTFTRLQDLLIGAALAAAKSARHPDTEAGPDRQAGRRTLAVAGSSALAIVLFAFLLVPDTEPWLYRGGFLVFCTGAAGLLTAALDPRSRTLRWALTRPFLVAAGWMSYGLYLWHWPLFVLFNPARTGLVGVPLAALRFVLTFAIAGLSYRLVEKPVRAGVLARRRGLRGEVGVLAATTLAVALATMLPGIGVRALPAQTSVAGTTAPDKGEGLAIHLIGDSVALGLHENFDPAQSPGIRLGVTARLGCGIFPEQLMVEGRRLPGDPACREWASTALQRVAAAAPKLAVLFAGIGQLSDIEVDGNVMRFGSPEYDDRLRRRYAAALAELRSSCPRIAIVNVPCNRIYGGANNPTAGILDDDARVAHLNTLLVEIAKDSDVPLIDLDKWVCGPGLDPVTRNGVRLRFDGLHYTKDGAALLWTWLAPQLIALGGTD